MLGFRTGARRRSPFPADCKISGVPLRLGRGRGPDGKPLTELVVTETDDLSNVQPTSYEYGALNREEGGVQPWGRFPKGFGLKQQKQFDDGAYDHTINALVYGV